MSKAEELKAKNENLFECNTILLNKNGRLQEENTELNNLLTKAKEIIKKILYEYQRLCLIKKETILDAEQFLKEIEK